MPPIPSSPATAPAPLAVKKAREDAAQSYFREHAGEWDKIRALHVAESEVEAAVDEALGPGPFTLLVDLGTGTGRMLELFAPRAARALGFDLSHDMLTYARMKLDRAGLAHAQARHGDLYNVPLPDGAADAVILHQVLHFLDDPAAAVAEAARLLKPGGRLLVVDFAPHELEFLREQSAHRRLGFASDQLKRWLKESGLKCRAAARPCAGRERRAGKAHRLAVGRDQAGRCPARRRNGRQWSTLRDARLHRTTRAAFSAAATSTCRSSSFRRRRRRWRRRCGARSAGSSRSVRTTSPSPMAPAARPASAPTPPSRAS